MSRSRLGKSFVFKRFYEDLSVRYGDKGFRGIDYTRTRSLAEGDDCCDYRLRDSRNRKSYRIRKGIWL